MTSEVSRQNLVWGLLQKNVESHPRADAIIHRNGRTSYRELLDDAESLASAFWEIGLRPDDVVSYQLPNWLEACVIVLAILRIGAIANPIVPSYRRREALAILRETESRLFIVPRMFRDFDHLTLARECRGPGMQIIVCGGVPDGEIAYDELLLTGRGRPEVNVDSDPNRDAFLLYTSGTESAPKGVRHSQRTLMTDARSIVKTSAITARDVIFMPSPITHITGVLYSHFLPQLNANKLCLMEIWDPDDAARLIERERCTWTTGATPFLQGLLNSQVVEASKRCNLRVFRCGGADVSPKLIRDARALGIDAFRSYGSTEHPTITGSMGEDPEKAATTDGLVHDHVDIRIVEPGTDGPPLPTGTSGEIQTRGPELFLGYRDPRLNAAAFASDGWFRTGDIGLLDEQRYLTVQSRLKDIIIRKGENISAKQIEELLMEHPALAQVAVIPVADRERGELVAAICVLRKEQTFSMIDMTQHLTRHGLARHKFPEMLTIVDSLPTNAAGKVKKNMLREQYSGDPAPPS